MTDVLRISRPTKTSSQDTWDDANGRYVPAPATVIYEGFGIVSTKGWNPRNEVSAGQTMTMSTYEISVPLGNVELNEDDVIEVLESLRSPYLFGKFFIVKSIILTSYAISHKVLAEIWDGKRPR